MRLGAQMSAAGGVWKAFARAEQAGCEATMVYTKSNRQWRAKPISEQDIEKCHAETAKYRGQIEPLVVHAAYLINVASPKEDLWEKSRDALRDELVRAEQLGLELVVMHPGSHTGAGEAAGLGNIVRALREVITDTAGSATRICLELMAGQGTNLGATFEQLAYLLTETDAPNRTGICLDTCHAFAAGYDFRSADSYNAMLTQMEAAFGLDQVKVFHFNDSKHELGSGKDRHEHIGEGFIGAEGFAHFVNDPRWANHPAILETPKKIKGDDRDEFAIDRMNLERLRGLIV